MKKTGYKKSGVDITRADEFIRGIKQFVSKDKLTKISAFGSLLDLSPYVKKYPNPVLVTSTDGVGTKLKVAQQLRVHNTVGIDLVAMNVNDIVCLGAKPLLFLDYIACAKVDKKVLSQVVKGISRGLKACGCALLGGETAQMPGMYKPGEYDLAGFCAGIVSKSKIIDGRKIKKGDLVIGLESSGPHSNGFSLIRKVLGPSGIKKHAKVLLEPTRIYVNCVLAAVACGGVNAIAHVTGGGFYKKATKVLPSGYGMVIDEKSWRAPEIFKVIQKKGKISPKEMYTVFNMGIGMILIVDKAKAAKIIKTISQFKIKSHIIGEVVKSSVSMRIT